MALFKHTTFRYLEYQCDALAERQAARFRWAIRQERFFRHAGLGAISCSRRFDRAADRGARPRAMGNWAVFAMGLGWGCRISNFEPGR